MFVAVRQNRPDNATSGPPPSTRHSRSNQSRRQVFGSKAFHIKTDLISSPLTQMQLYGLVLASATKPQPLATLGPLGKTPRFIHHLPIGPEDTVYFFGTYSGILRGAIRERYH